MMYNKLFLGCLPGTLNYLYVKGVLVLEQLFDKTLLITRFDRNYEHCADLYDHLPYKRDFDACNGPIASSNSGNIIKYYLYQLEDKFYPVKYSEELVAKRIHEYETERANLLVPEVETEELPPVVNGITSEQMENLLNDPEEETEHIE